MTETRTDTFPVWILAVLALALLVLDPGVHFLQKPFLMEDIAAKVREVMDETQNANGKYP